MNLRMLVFAGTLLASLLAITPLFGQTVPKLTPEQITASYNAHRNTIHEQHDTRRRWGVLIRVASRDFPGSAKKQCRDPKVAALCI